MEKPGSTPSINGRAVSQTKADVEKTVHIFIRVWQTERGRENGGSRRQRGERFRLRIKLTISLRKKRVKEEEKNKGKKENKETQAARWKKVTSKDANRYLPPSPTSGKVPHTFRKEEEGRERRGGFSKRWRGGEGKTAFAGVRDAHGLDGVSYPQLSRDQRPRRAKEKRWDIISLHEKGELLNECKNS